MCCSHPSHPIPAKATLSQHLEVSVLSHLVMSARFTVRTARTEGKEGKRHETKTFAGGHEECSWPDCVQGQPEGVRTDL